MSETLETRLKRIVRHAYDHAPAVRSIFDQAGLTPEDIQTLADLDRIPVTSKDRLVELQQKDPPFGGFLATPIETLEHIFLSPGPLYEPHSGDSPVLDSIREVCALAGFTAGDVVINTFGYHLIPTGLAVDQVLRAMGVTVIAAGVGNAELQLKMITDFGVSGYVGTPSWLMALLEKGEAALPEFRSRLSLKSALLSAEPLPPPLRQTFVEQYGLTVLNAYGTAELGFLAYNLEGGLAMHLLESSIIQVVNPETGQTVPPGESGEVVVTTFNPTYPLIRLGTGDLALNIDPAPGESCQRDRSIILVGRVGEAVKVRGMFVHPNQLRFAVSQVPGITGFRAVVTRPENRDVFAMEVVLGEGADREAVQAGLEHAVRSVCRVKVDAVVFVEGIEQDAGEALIADHRTLV